MEYFTFLPRLLNMSLTASVVICVVLAVRLLLKKAPKAISYALWLVVLFRLLCPVSFQSGVSVLSLLDAPARADGAIEYIPEASVPAEAPAPMQNVPVSEAPEKEQTPPKTPLFAYVWMLGTAGILVSALFSYIKLRGRLKIRVLLRENIYLADDIDSPFVVGLVRPKIYLPCGLDEAEREYIILHEKHHIRRLDPVFKALGFLALAIHWFNPLVWVAFILAADDMEMSCDEAVIRRLGSNIRADYSAALLALATGRRVIAGTPLAFGEGDAKKRIKNLSRWKKPAAWGIAAAGIVCAAVAVCLLANPRTEFSIPEASVQKASVFHFNKDDGQARELSRAQISEMVGRFSGIKRAKRSEEYAGFTPFSQLCVFLTDGSLVYAEAYDSEGGDVIVTYQGVHYAVRDDDFAAYLQNVCMGGDVSAAVEISRPMLKMGGTYYINPYMPVSELPFGYALAGALSEEEAHNTGLAGIKYYINPDEPEELYTYQECGTPVSLDTVDTERRQWAYIRWIPADTNAIAARRLTLDDVRRLAEKGEALTWSDFAPYASEDIGSGMYIRQYIIDGLFDLLIGGDENAEPQYIHLRNRNINAWVDIRTKDVDGFIEAYRDISAGDVSITVVSAGSDDAEFRLDNKSRVSVAIGEYARMERLEDGEWIAATDRSIDLFPPDAKEIAAGDAMYGMIAWENNPLPAGQYRYILEVLLIDPDSGVKAPVRLEAPFSIAD